MFDQVQDYRPVYSFWLFSFEHTNPVLKSFNINNHSGGDIGATCVRGFTREVRLRIRMRTYILYGDSLESSKSKHLLSSGRDHRGTLSMKALSEELDNAKDGQSFPIIRLYSLY